jgi:tetratricopeptide (TPR) repeat protein
MKQTFILFLALGLVRVHGQILQDISIKSSISKGLAATYNFDFAEAREHYQKVQAKYPQSPAYATLMHMMLYAQYAPVKDYPKAKAEYLKYLNMAIGLSETYISKNENDPEAIFFVLSNLGSLAAWQADMGDMMKAVNTARKAFPYMKKGLKLNEKFPDFYYTSGLYNYYIEQYPIDNPIVKPFMVFFTDGDRKLGLKQLELCTQKALFTGVEASYYQAYIYIKHENKFTLALQNINELLAKYPNNLMLKTRKAECLTFLGQYQAAEPFLEQIQKHSGNVYQVAYHIFKGIISERQQDLAAAKQHYQKAIKYPEDPRYTKDYLGLAHLGLCRIAIHEKKTAEAKAHLKRAEDQIEYLSSKTEAKRLDKIL